MVGKFLSGPLWTLRDVTIQNLLPRSFGVLFPQFGECFLPPPKKKIPDDTVQLVKPQIFVGWDTYNVDGGGDRTFAKHQLSS